MSCLVSSFFYLLFSSFLLFVSSHVYLLFHLFFYLISKLTSQLFFISSHCIFSSDLQLMHLTCKFFQALEDKQRELENYKSALSSAKAQYQQTREALQRSKEAEVSNKLYLLIYFTLTSWNIFAVFHAFLLSYLRKIEASQLFFISSQLYFFFRDLCHTYAVL